MARPRRKKAKSNKVFKDVVLFFLVVILFIMLLIFMVSKLVSQQQMLSQQEKDKRYYAAQREQLEAEKIELENKLSKIDSEEYIESIAREKLNMYYPNERLYLDASSAP